MKLAYLPDLVLFGGSIGLLVTAVLAAQNGVSNAVYIVLLLIAVPSALSLGLQCYASRRTDQNVSESVSEARVLLSRLLRPNSATTIGVIEPGLAIFILIVARLILGSDLWEGDPSQLDFGWKYGEEGGEENISFAPEFNSFGHCIQGVIAGMLAMPAGLLAVGRGFKCRDGCSAWVVRFLPLLGAFMTLYPSYNLIKRYVHSGDAFAGSSFSNNGLEWASGFVIGLAFGLLSTSFAHVSGLKALDTETESGVEERWKDELSWVTRSAEGWPGRIMTFLRYLLYALLLLTSFFAALLFGLTWHTCLDGATDCVNYSEDRLDPAILGGMLVIRGVSILLGASAFRSRKGCS